ncbi:type I-E CRISPR-associated protein Cas6/Cse3/CasE [Streptomyces sp. NPDC004673]
MTAASTTVRSLTPETATADASGTTTVWLTRLRLNPAARTVQRDLRDAAALHRRIMTLVPDGLGDNPRARAGILFRLDHDGTGAPTLLVQSCLPTDTRRLPKDYADTQTRDLTPLLSALRPGLTVRYRLLGNAVKRCGRNSTEGRWKQAIALRGPDAEQWWTTQADKAGLTLHTLLSDNAESLTAWHAGTPDAGSGKVAVHHQGTRFDGTATVHDADALRHAVLNGIGRSKTYGCGLLSLAPATADG